MIVIATVILIAQAIAIVIALAIVIVMVTGISRATNLAQGLHTSSLRGIPLNYPYVTLGFPLQLN